MRKRFLHTIAIVLLAIPLAGQVAMQIEESPSPKTTMVYLERSETLSFDQQRLPDAQILSGNVCFRHDSAWMYCDSAYFFEASNSLQAFGHVHMVQGDSIEGFGQFLYYDGNRRMAQFRRKVKLVHRRLTISTDSLNYDRAKNIAYYFNGGKIQDSLNVLTSRWGQYNPDSYLAIFHRQVHLSNDRFTLTADTLHYNTHTYRTDLIGPTQIVYDTTTTILSTKGWYNTNTEKSMLLKRSKILQQDGRTLTADTIFYDKKIGYGHCFGHIESIDSAHHLTLYGNRSEVWEKEPHGYVTDSAKLVDWSDTIFTYMHADTLFSESVPYRVFQLQPRDSIWVDSVLTAQAPDTIWKDTSYNQVRAYYFVRIYRQDMQGVCDSMHYNARDSILSLYGEPICWNQSNQVSADSIHVYCKNGEVDYLHGIGNALAVKQEGWREFDQLGGKEMTAYVKDEEVYLVDVNGNAETIFYPREEDGTFIGVNRTQSSNVKLYLENRKIHHVVFTPATSGTLFPMQQVTDEQARLSTFFWEEDCRPQSPEDIFRHAQRIVRPQAGAISASDTQEEEETPVSRTPKSKSEKRTQKKDKQ